MSSSTAGLGEVNRRLHPRRPPRLPRVLLRRACSRSRTRRSRSRTPSRTGSTASVERARDGRRSRRLSTPEEVGGALPAACAARCSSSRATATTASRSSAGSRSPSSPAPSTCGSPAPGTPDGAPSGARQPADPRLRRAASSVRLRGAAHLDARPTARPRRALLVSSPIGLGHAWRDVAIARELRRRVPGLEVQWLAQPPVTTLLEACGETIHPASADLAPEAAGVDAEAGEHELHAFQMLRRLDEIFCANFMVFHDLVARGAVRRLDRRRGVGGRLLPAREPGAQDGAVRLADRLRRRAADGGGRRARGVPRRRLQRADGRARRAQSARCATARSSSATPDDLVPEPLGPGLPTIRDWTREHFAVRRLRHRLRRRPRSPTATRCAPSSATAPDETGLRRRGRRLRRSASHLLRRAVAAFPQAKQRVPELRMIVVAGPRIDPASLPHGDGVEVRGYVHRLYRAARRLRRRDQPRRPLDDDGADRGAAAVPLLPAAPALRAEPPRRPPARPPSRRPADGVPRDGPEEIAAALVEELAREPESLTVTAGGAERAAETIAALL